jgi:hypothetical protein
MSSLDARIQTLPTPPLPATLATRVLFLARAALARGGAGEPPRSHLGSGMTAAAVFSAITIYLTWAVEFLDALAS